MGRKCEIRSMLLRVLVAICMFAVGARSDGATAGLEEAYNRARNILDGKEEGGKLSEAIALLTSVAQSGAGSEIVAAAMRDLGELHLGGLEGGVIRQDWTRAVSLLEGAAGLGDPAAAHFMAFVYSTGAEMFGRRPDEEAAASLEESAALKGYAPAIRALAWRYKDGVGTRKDCETSLVLYKDAAAAAVAEVREPLLELKQPLGDADYLRDGGMVKRRRLERWEKELRDHYEAKAKVGLITRGSSGMGPESLDAADALYELGRMAQLGTHGTPKNATTAALMYQASLKAFEHPGASAALGYLLAVGDGIKQNIDDAVDLLEYASRMGELQATALLGYIHQHGAGIDSDPVKARALYTEAAEGNEPLALYCLAELLLQEGSYFEALTYYARAAEAGLLVAAQQLAHMFELGIGTRRSCHDAAELYKLAAETGSCVESVRRGVTLATSHSTEEAGLVALARAAAEGIEVAQANAAWMLARRRGFKGNSALTAARRLYGMAAAQGSVEAEAELGRIMYQGGDAAGAARHLVAASKGGHVDATLRLARMLEAGNGVRQDLGQAEQLYKHLLVHTPFRLGEWGTLARKAGLSARLIQIRAKSVFAGAFAALRRVLDYSSHGTGGGGGGSGDAAGKPQAGTGDQGRSAERQGASTQSSGGGASGASGGESSFGLLEPSNLFFLVVDPDFDGGKDAQCLSAFGRLTECDENAILTTHGTRGREALVSFWGRSHAASDNAMCLTASPAAANNLKAPVGVGSAPVGSGGAASQAWHLEAGRLTVDRGERCVAVSKVAEGGVVVQPSHKGCAAVEVYRVPPFLIESEDVGGCFDGASFVQCDTHDKSLRWGTQLMDTASGGRYIIYKSEREDDKSDCLLLEDGKLALGSCAAIAARGWSLAQGRLATVDGELCLAVEEVKGSRSDADPVAAVMSPCSERFEPLGIRF